MCGLAGEIRFDGRAADVGALGRMCDCMVHRGPDCSGVWPRGPVALGHRRLSIIDLSAAGAQPMVDSQLGLTVAFNGCIYNYKRPARRAGERRLPVLLHLRHRGDRQGVRAVGHDLRRPLPRHVRVRHRRARHRPAGPGPRPAGHQAAVPRPERERLRFASTLPTLLAAGGTDTSIDRTALAYYMSFHSVVPAPRTILNGVRKLPPATLRVIEPDGSYREHLYWEPSFTRDPDRADWTERDWQEALIAKLRTAVERRMVADVPVGVLLSGGIDSSLVVALLAEAGQHGLKTFSIGFDSAGGESGDEFEYSTLVAQRFDTDHHRIKIDTAKLLPGIDAAIGAMSEPMVSHDCVAFYLLSEEVAKSIKVVQSGQGADEVLGGYDWYPPLAGVPREDAVEAYSGVFFDRRWSAMADLLQPDWLIDHDAPTAYIAERFGRPGAETSVDAALRNDTTVMLVDDPVKRVDNMTMAWGLEARVPFLDHELVELAGSIPPELKLADGGKGVLKRAGRGIVPDEVIDRTKGYFPVPAIRQLEGPYLDRVRDALTDPAARARGLFQPGAVERLLAATQRRPGPRSAPTRCGSSRCWRCGCRTREFDDGTGDGRGHRRDGTGRAAGRRLGQLGTDPLPRRRPDGVRQRPSGSPEIYVQDLDPGVEPPPDHAVARPGDRGDLVGRRGLAGRRRGDRRRGPYPGLGGPARRHRRPADRRLRRRARRARAVDPLGPPGGDLHAARERRDRRLPGQPGHRRADPAGQRRPDPRARHVGRRGPGHPPRRTAIDAVLRRGRPGRRCRPPAAALSGHRRHRARARPAVPETPADRWSPTWRPMPGSAVSSASRCRSGRTAGVGSPACWRRARTPSSMASTPTTPASCCCWSGTSTADAARSSCTTPGRTSAGPFPVCPARWSPVRC